MSVSVPRPRGSQKGSLAGQSVASFGGTRSYQYTASRIEMMQMGVPEDYIDALLDEGYMERLINANDELNKIRRMRLQRYLGMNKIILVFLCLQSLLGIWIALWKTILQPDVLFSAEAKLQDVDLVLMMDSAKHNQKNMDVQHKTVMDFTGVLNRTLIKHKEGLQVTIQQQMEDAQAEEGSIVQKLPLLKYAFASATAEAHVSGGWMRVSTGTFNAEKVTALHGFTRDLGVQKEKLKSIDAQSYTSSAQWHGAMQNCEGMLKAHGNPHAKRYCIIIGDNEAMCRKHLTDNVAELCKRWGDSCPEAIADIGNLLEYEHEMDLCTDYARTKLAAQDAEVIMMFTVGSEKEEQIRFENPAFRRFVQGATGCQIIRNTETTTDEDGQISTKRWYKPDDNCFRFILASSFEDLVTKSKKVADGLTAVSGIDKKDNAYKDYKYLFFLILPLNLVFYIVWSKIVRCTMEVKKKANRAMGVKKKMIKVSKTLVEKERHDSIVEALEAQLTEVELAEVSSLRPVIGCGVPMTLRARLKGGYMRKNVETGVCDGHGKAFSEDAFWNFEPVDQTRSMIRDCAVTGGQRVRMRNSAGQFLRVTSSGTGFVTEKHTAQRAFGLSPTLEGRGYDDDDLGEDTEFIVEPMDSAPGEEDFSSCHLGDTIRIKSVATGKYLRIHKDGSCDGMGESSSPESQMAVDLGGSTIPTSAVVTLRSARTACYMHAGAEGELNALPGGEEWKYWMMEKKEGLGPSEETDGGTEGNEGDAARRVTQWGQPSATLTDTDEVAGGETSGVPMNIGTLKVGDVITLKGMNQHYLRVLDDGTVRCGDPVTPADQSEGSEAPALGTPGATSSAAVNELEATQAASADASSADGCTEFVVQRMGMGLIHKHDSTVRSMAEICLRPAHAVGGSGLDTARYLSVNGDGTVDSMGRISSRDIGFVLELASIQEMVAPVQSNLMRGDVELMISPLWNKHEVKRLEALSAPWTSAAEMNSFRGAVVVANDNGQYTVPKAKGESFQGWVAVVKDGVDIKKAAKQAKAQGATGIIVRSSQVLSLDKLSRNVGEEPPELPAVFMDETVADSLNERGINCQGCEFKGQNRTAALRSIGRVGAARDSGDFSERKTVAVNAMALAADVFKNVGALMVEEHRERANEPEEEEEEMEDVEESDNSAGKGFQWKVASNTHYLWSSSAGGAARMNVNFGNKAPPSAKQKVKVDLAGNVVHETDASQTHRRKSLTKLTRRPTRKTVTVESFHSGESKSALLGVTMIESSDLANHRLAGELNQLDLVTPAQAAEPLEQLPDDSDFKIQYHFEEVEVAVDEDPEATAEEELIDDSGAVVGRFAVPVKRFWMVAFGMLFSTALLSLILYFLLCTSDLSGSKEVKREVYDPSFDNPDAIVQPGESHAPGVNLPSQAYNFMSKTWH